ncbi:MAG: hypothetical protein ABMB14_13250 [Myxococcota bacterium]
MRLLVDGVGTAFFRLELQHAVRRLGERAEEVRLVPVLLAWLCCELRLWPPGPSRERGRRIDDQDLTRRAVWLALFPELDANHWDRLLEKVMTADSSSKALDWYEAARTSAAHLRAVSERPTKFLSSRESAEPGDLVWLGGRVLRVVRKDVGGPQRKRIVQWLEPRKGSGSKEFDNGHLLRPTAWQDP